jgi:hypothetical protein
MNTNHAKVAARMRLLLTAHPTLLRAPGPTRHDGTAKPMPTTHAYRVWSAGLITDRQARALGCVVRGPAPKLKRERRDAARAARRARRAGR